MLRTRAALGTMLALVLLLGGAAFTAAQGSTAQDSTAQDGTGGAAAELTLRSPWNFVALTTSGPIEEVLAGAVYLESAFRWDAGRAQFDSWQKRAPASINSLQSVAAGDALWLRTSLTETLSQPVASEAREVVLLRGWNTVGWTGPDTLADVVAGLLGASIVITYDALPQAFLRYATDAPTLLNSLDTVFSGQGVWAFLESAGTATIPPAAAAQEQPAPEEQPPEEEQPAPAVEFALTSSAFEANGRIPVRYSCEGADLSPPLAIAGLPEGTLSLALIMDDPDAPGGTFVHWVEFNIAPLSEIVENAGPIGTQGRSSFGTNGYGGPCPPLGETHRYFFTLYALDAELDLAAGATKAQLLAAMEGRVLVQTELVGLYTS